jgi:diguanylate cyclase
MEVLEKTRAAVAGNAWTKREITVSVGVATMTDEAWTRTEFANLADMALYRSKENGRNQVTHAQTLDNAEAA